MDTRSLLAVHIYSLQVWDWPRACNCQEGEIFLALFYLREFVREEKKRRRRNRDQRTFKEIYHTYITFCLHRKEMGMKNLEKKYTFWNSVENFSVKKIVRLKKRKGFDTTEEPRKG